MALVLPQNTVNAKVVAFMLRGTDDKVLDNVFPGCCGTDRHKYNVRADRLYVSSDSVSFLDFRLIRAAFQWRLKLCR